MDETLWFLYSSSKLFLTTFGLRSSFKMHFYWCNGKASAARVVDIILFSSLAFVGREKTLCDVFFLALLCIDNCSCLAFLCNSLQRLPSTMLIYFFFL